MMGVQETSKEAYHGDKMKGRDLTERLMEYALEHKRFTCKMAARALDVETGTLSGIITPLVGENNNGILRRELDKHPCKITGNNAFYLYHKDYTGQQSLIN